MRMMTGQQFGRLRVIGEGYVSGKRRYVLCECSCGTTKLIRSDGLLSGVVLSCGCIHREWLATKSLFQPGNTIRPNSVASGERNGQWKGDAVGDKAAHDRCRALYPDPLGPCEGEGCNRDARDRHHKDSNAINNGRDNIEFLCRACHMKADGMAADRVAQMVAARKGQKESVETRARKSEASKKRWLVGVYDGVHSRGADGRWQKSQQ